MEKEGRRQEKGDADWKMRKTGERGQKKECRISYFFYNYKN